MKPKTNPNFGTIPERMVSVLFQAVVVLEIKQSSIIEGIRRVSSPMPEASVS